MLLSHPILFLLEKLTSNLPLFLTIWSIVAIFELTCPVRTSPTTISSLSSPEIFIDPGLSPETIKLEFSPLMVNFSPKVNSDISWMMLKVG